MANTVLRGLNWGHRRATEPLQAAASHFTQCHPACTIEWTVQPLSGFEHGLDYNVVDRFDLIVFDHPFCGDIADRQLFQPVSDDHAGSLDDGVFVGRSLHSYRYGGALWGVPVDGATQTAVYRPDLLSRYGEWPQTWDDIVRLGRAVRNDGLWLGLAGLNPHAFLVVAALCANLGQPLCANPESKPFDRSTLAAAMAAMRELQPFLHPDWRRFNAIDLHEAMATRNDIVYCPAVYAYLTYAEADHAKPLRFGAFPGPTAPHHAGTVLGGTGLAMTRSCSNPDSAAAFLAFAGSDECQRLFARHHGQPARKESWSDDQTNLHFGEAFRATRDTMDAAWMRPRFKGYIRRQHALGTLFEATEADVAIDGLMRDIERIWSGR